MFIEGADCVDLLLNLSLEVYDWNRLAESELRTVSHIHTIPVMGALRREERKKGTGQLLVELQ